MPNTNDTSLPSIVTVTREEARKMRKAELQAMIARERIEEFPATYRNHEEDAMVYVRANYPTKRDCLLLVDCITRSAYSMNSPPK